MTIALNDHNSAYVKVFLSGDWSSHSAVAYVAEFFIQNGGDSYAEPGIILSEYDNLASDYIQAKIVDPSSDSFTIQLKLSDADDGTLAGKITYQIMGEITSVS